MLNESDHSSCLYGVCCDVLTTLILGVKRYLIECACVVVVCWTQPNVKKWVPN